MNRPPEEKFLLLFEATKRSLLTADMLLHRIVADLASLEHDIDRSIDIGERAIPPLISSVAFIDFTHRFGSLVDALPLINKGKPEVRQLRAVLKQVEIARNHLQHMRGDLSSNEPVDYPVLGSLAWANYPASYTIFLSQSTKAKAFSLVYDTQNQCWAAQHQYTVKDATIDLDTVLQEMHAVYKWIVTTVSFSDSAIADLKWGTTHSLGFRVSLDKVAQH